MTINVRPRLYNETDFAYERRLEAAERQARGADDLRAYMRQKAAGALARLTANIRIVDDPTPVAPVCPDCGGLGMIRYDVPIGHERFGKLYPCPADGCSARAAQQAQRTDALLERSGVPGVYREMTFQTWVNLPADQRAGKDLAGGAAWLWSQTLSVKLSEAAEVFGHPDAGRFSATAKPWLVLQGDLGVGKTGLAASATNALAAAGKQPLYYRLQEMFSEIQSRYGENETGRNADDIIGQIQRAPALILDECNVPGLKASEDKSRLMEEIVRYRHARQLPTLFTLNADQKQFETMWGRRTADVVFNSAHWLVLSGARLRVVHSAVQGF